ncbi:perlucin-like protein [Mytilus californianus]|uniref:perlucin-like protein n=1 Tax=Mytilus californianus TaxID=6549 RepID=UPI00224630F0|nr:perlucin-like protein [Mytilus californianus]
MSKNPITCNGCFSYGASLYKVFDDPKNWTNAVEECRCRGGFLAEIESAEENSFIKNIAKERFAATGAIYYWLGAYNFNQDSDMEWIRNPSKPMPFTDWFEVPPSCTECFSYASSIYKVIEDTVNWEMARDNCYNLGGKLVEMETQDENDFIKSILTVRNANITGNTIYYLGGYKFKADENIRWISTSSLEMPFTDMAPGEPNNPTSELCLGTIKYFGFQWVDLPCAWLHPYICEFVH